MKRNTYLLLILLLPAVLFLNACKNDFDIASDWKEIPIVYGLLNSADTAQYIKVTKAFLDKKTSAVTMAQINDSLYFPNISVELHEIKNSTDIKTITLQKVDLNNEGFGKEKGTFANSPNWGYKTKEALTPTSRYKLIVKRADGSELTTAEVALAQDFRVSSPNPTITSSKTLLFINSNGQYPKGDAPTRISYYSGVGGKIYDCYLRFRYKEKNVTTNVTEYKFIDWQIINGKVSDDVNQKDISLSDDNIIYKKIYPYLASKIEVNPNVIRTAMQDSLELHFWAGGQELYNYNIIQYANSGITQSSIHPIYSNLSNGYGMYSSRFHKIVTGLAFSNLSLDTLRYGADTKKLGFQ